MIAIAMLVVGGTGDESVFRFIQRALPSLSVRARLRVVVSILKTPHKQLPQGRM
jgi:hypothetical protein